LKSINAQEEKILREVANCTDRERQQELKKKALRVFVWVTFTTSATCR
jgi:hypothetical protein